MKVLKPVKILENSSSDYSHTVALHVATITTSTATPYGLTSAATHLLLLLRLT